MMVFVLVGLGVFMVVRFITEAIEAPSWFVVALSIVLATVGDGPDQRECLVGTSDGGHRFRLLPG
jgi:hypothetical protein